MFSPGQQVVCIDAEFCPELRALFGRKLPQEGAIYSVRDANPRPVSRGDLDDALHLSEINGPLDRWGSELGFSPHRFRAA